MNLISQANGCGGGTSRLNDIVEQGIKMMNTLQEIQIKEATFEDNTYFIVQDERRTIATKGIILNEDSTELTIRIAKESSDITEYINAPVYKPTQKIIAAYFGTSQSSVSIKSNKE